MVPASAAGPAAFVPAGHWSREALARLAALGWVDGGVAYGGWPLRRSHARNLLAEASHRAALGGDADAALLAGEYLRRWRAELPPATRFLPALRSTVGYGGEWSGVRGGAHFWVEEIGWGYPGPVALPDRAEPFVSAAVELDPHPRLAIAVEATAGQDSCQRGANAGRCVQLGESYLAAAAGRVDLWVGRRSLDFAGAGGLSLVLSPGTSFDGAGVALLNGVRLPGPLGRLGELRGMTVLARMERSGPVRHPLFWGTRLTLQPSPSLSLGLNRASLFGGSGNLAVTPRTVALMLLGLTDAPGKDSDFENQVASADFAWRIRLADQPLVVYGEWALDDVGFTWFVVPGILLGARMPALPRVPALSVGLEYVLFARSSRGHPPWYRHGALAEGWTDRGRPLGHPLGGHGREGALTWRIDAPQHSLLLAGRFFERSRGSENIFAPTLAGRSRGGTLRGVVHLPATLRLELDAEVERVPSRWIRSGSVAAVVSF